MVFARAAPALTAALLALTVTAVAHAQSVPPASSPPSPSSAVPLPATAPTVQNGGPKMEPSWPKTLADAEAEAQAKSGTAAPDVWTPQEIATAQARCTALLRTIDAVTVPEPSFKQGACGTPAPVQLLSIGKNPQVALSPPVVLTCDMVASIHTWLTREMQPLARRLLGQPVIKIETMSSYSCRNAYGRKRTRLSEHGRANAIDIRGFVTMTGESVEVLADWGPTAREIQAQVAAARAAQEKAAAEQAAAAAAARAATAAKSVTQVPAGATATAAQSQPAVRGSVFEAGTLLNSLPEVAGRLPGLKPGMEGETRTLSLTPPSRLGGPQPARKPAVAAPAPAPPPSAAAKTQFLRAAHESACTHFGTVLGPESNNAHKNHFHFDMAERATTNYCE